jgi:UDP-N-acetylglucosamine:LPS N-acetylglucosamine transferase
MKKILVVSSGGGHWVEVTLLRSAFEGVDAVYVSVNPDYADDVAEHRYYAVQDANRWDRWKFVILIRQLWLIVRKERPDMVISTGAAPGMLAIMMAKCLCRSRTIWVDSIANAERLSLSGQLVRPFADAWLTQWPHLQKEGGPDYWGGVF